MIGIDKLILNNVEIISIDWLIFNANLSCSVKQPVNGYSRSESSIELSRLQVNTKKDRFYLDVGTAKDANTGQIRPYQKLFINPASLLYCVNTRNISTPIELQKAIEIVCYKLKEDCGIIIDTTNARISNVEINANLQLNQPFCDYGKVFTFIRSALPKRYKNVCEYMTGDETTGFLAGNTRVCVKFYDKQREAAITADAAGRMLRIEYTFKTQEKVKDEFGYDTLKELLEGFNAVKTAYISNVQADILTTLPKALEAERKRHKVKLIQAMQAQPRSYISEWLAMSQSIFDCELLRQALLSTLRAQKLTARNNRQRIKQLQLLVEKRQKDESELLFGQLALLNEITQKLNVILGTR